MECTGKRYLRPAFESTSKDDRNLWIGPSRVRQGFQNYHWFSLKGAAWSDVQQGLDDQQGFPVRLVVNDVKGLVAFEGPSCATILKLSRVELNDTQNISPAQVFSNVV